MGIEIRVDGESARENDQRYKSQEHDVVVLSTNTPWHTLLMLCRESLHLSIYRWICAIASRFLEPEAF